MRGPFQYISQDKLGGMSPTRRWWKRVGLDVRGKVPLIPASAGVTLSPDEAASLATRIEEVEKRLRSERKVATAHELAFGDPGGLFDFHGPAISLAVKNTYWVMSASDDVAVLLVGSLKHAIGATLPDVTPPALSPSVTSAYTALTWLYDVLGGRNPRGEDLAALLAACWEEGVENALGRGSFADQPRVRGIADYRDRAVFDRDQGELLAEIAGRPEITAAVVGSPFWVESAPS